MGTSVGILHPGQMGSSVAAAARDAGCAVYWVAAGRSTQSRTRAEQQGLVDAGSLAQLCAVCDVIVSVCPPAAAEEVAAQVIVHGFRGLFVDANAIAPARAQAIAASVQASGATFVDGGIIGPPAWRSGTTWLYLSGAAADRVAACFAGSRLATPVLGPEIGKASALKMVYAAYTKGTTALLAAILATADSLGVRADLAAAWERDRPGFAAQTETQVREVTAKAWRFAGEMEEIAATFAAAGLPGGFHLAAADLYTRLAGFKDAPATPPLDAVLDALRRPTLQPTLHPTE